MTSRQNKARSKKKTTADAAVFVVMRRAKQCRPQAVRRRTTVTRAPRSRARLISATNSRRFVAKPRTPHPIPQAAQLFKCRSANVRGRGGRPLVLSLGGSRGILSFEKESIPLYPCSATGAAIPTALCAESKKRGPCFRTAPFLCRFSSRSRYCIRSRYCSHSHCCIRSHRRRRRSG